MKHSEQTDKLWPAIVKARQEMKNPTKDAENPGFKRDGKALRYADLAACLEAIDAATHGHGLVTLQELTGDAAGVAVSTLILHESGQWVQFDPLFVPAAKLDAQGFGSAATYARRYAVKAAWNIADEDDDGNAASPRTPQSSPKSKAAQAPAPPGYGEFIKAMEAAAAQGFDAFSAAGHKAAPEHREYLKAHDAQRYTALTKQAKAAKQSASAA